MAVLMTENATDEIKQFILDDKLNPDFILPTLDGLELENLFGRSLRDIETNEPLTILLELLRRYVEEICPGKMTFEQLHNYIIHTDDVVELFTKVCRELEIYCHHEIELISSIILAIWNKTH